MSITPYRTRVLRICSLDKKELFLERVKFDEEFCNDMISKCEAFFKTVLFPELIGKCFSRPFMNQGLGYPTEIQREWTNVKESSGYLFHVHEDEHVKKIFSTAVIDNEDTHSNIVRGHWCTGEDKTTCAPWSLHRRTHCEYSTSFKWKYQFVSLQITMGNSTEIGLLSVKFPWHMQRYWQRSSRGRCMTYHHHTLNCNCFYLYLNDKCIKLSHFL